MASNFPQSHRGFLSELPGAVFTETIAWQHIPNSIRIWGQGKQRRGECWVRCYRYWRTDTACPQTRAAPSLHKHESFCVIVCKWVPNVATCGWVVVGRFYSSLEVQSPFLAEMFAQLKHHLLRHITEGCQQQSESTNDHCSTENVFNHACVEEGLAEQELLAPPRFWCHRSNFISYEAKHKWSCMCFSVSQPYYPSPLTGHHQQVVLSSVVSPWFFWLKYIVFLLIYLGLH